MKVTWRFVLQAQRDVFVKKPSLLGGEYRWFGCTQRSIQSAAQRTGGTQFLSRVIPVFKLVRRGHTLGQQKQDQDGRPEKTGSLGRHQFHSGAV